ncbi:MAG: phosphoesterase, partial [Desulfuromonadales bacterium]|nr:phosphoesterase [Desulfuromonadales bacterium]NIR33187.1 phosphoesterase [Desulfuromonadales bacterium]NIS39416.1 phosphoesterase [Desulfuromonadales bacterium]
MGLTDYHCHLLPDIDDGADSLDESLAMARLLSGAGYTRVHCTPHCIRGCYDTTARQVEDAVRALQGELTAAGIALELVPGMEYYLDEHFPAQLESPRPLGDTDLLLVEAPSQAHPELIKENIFRIVRRGFTPLFAHPERCGWLAPVAGQTGLWAKALGLFRRTPALEDRRPSPLDSLGDMGCRFQA